jgi:hypothetical protein
MTIGIFLISVSAIVLVAFLWKLAVRPELPLSFVAIGIFTVLTSAVVSSLLRGVSFFSVLLLKDPVGSVRGMATGYIILLSGLLLLIRVYFPKKIPKQKIKKSKN